MNELPRRYKSDVENLKDHEKIQNIIMTQFSYALETNAKNAADMAVFKRRLYSFLSIIFGNSENDSAFLLFQSLKKSLDLNEDCADSKYHFLPINIRRKEINNMKSLSVDFTNQVTFHCNLKL